MSADRTSWLVMPPLCKQWRHLGRVDGLGSGSERWCRTGVHHSLRRREGMTEPVGDLASVVSGWRECAIPLVSARPGVGVEDLRPLVGLIADAKVVGLGESSHGAGELFTMKHRLIEFLVTELGFTACAFEDSHAGCLPIDDYVRRDVGEPATALTSQGYIAWDTEEVLACWRGCVTITPMSRRSAGLGSGASIPVTTLSVVK